MCVVRFAGQGEFGKYLPGIIELRIYEHLCSLGHHTNYPESQQ